MGIFAVTDSSGALGVVGRFLRGISSMGFELSSPAYNEKYARVNLDDVLVASGNIPTGGLSLSYGEVQLSEGVHTVKCYVWNVDPKNSFILPVSTYTVEITVKNYTAPVISAFSAQRCLANGTPNGSGVYVRYALTAAIDPVTVDGVDRNAPLIALRYREKGAEEWTTVQLSDEDFAWNEAGAVVAALTLPASITFDFGAYVSDRWKFAAAETALPRDVRPFNARMINGHLSTCIGTLADEEGKHKVVQPTKFTEDVEFVKAPVFVDRSGALAKLSPVVLMRLPTAESAGYNATYRYWLLDWTQILSNYTPDFVLGGASGQRKFAVRVAEEGFYHVHFTLNLSQSDSNSGARVMILRLDPEWEFTAARDYMVGSEFTSATHQQMIITVSAYSNTTTCGEVSGVMYCEAGQIIMPTFCMLNTTKTIASDGTNFSMQRIG